MRLLINLYLNSKRPILTIFILLFLLNTSVIAKDDTGQYLVMGLGNLSCKSFLIENDDGAAYYLSWLAGYMTAYNHLHEDTYSILGETKTIDQIESWLRDYCTINGDEKFESAILSLLKNLKFFRLKQKP